MVLQFNNFQAPDLLHILFKFLILMKVLLFLYMFPPVEIYDSLKESAKISYIFVFNNTTCCIFHR